MKRAERDEWVNALRNPTEGGFEQGARYMNNGGRQCCLGVKAELDVRAGRHGIIKVEDRSPQRYGYGVALLDGDSIMPTAAIVNAWGMVQSQCDALAQMNDELTDWSVIARLIERNIGVED